MIRILKLSLLLCVTRLALMLLNSQREPFMSLFVAPAVGIVGCVLLGGLAVDSIVRPAREFGADALTDGSEA